MADRKDENTPWSGLGFWEDRYQDQDIGWDLGEPNPTLIRLVQECQFTRGSSMLVPGCGNGHEVMYFADLGYNVSAVDWSKIATDDLRVRAKRQKLTLEILREDFWKIPESWFGGFDVFLEQTFFCAIDKSDRPRYVDMVKKLLRPRGTFVGTLFVTEKPYADDEISILDNGGPPFWNSKEEVLDYFSSDFDIQLFRPSLAPPERFSAFEWEARFVLKDKS